MDVDEAAFGRAAAFVVHAAATDPKEPAALRCVLIEADGTTLRLAATDRHRLAAVELDLRTDAPPGRARALVPAVSFALVATAAEAEGGPRVPIAIGSDAVEVGDRTLERVTGEFPDVTPFLHAPPGAHRSTVARDDLVDALESLPDAAAVALRLAPGDLRLATDVAAAHLDIRFDGPELELSCNPAYLHDAVAAFPAGSTVVVDVVSPLDPMWLHVDDAVAVLMPVRVGNRPVRRRA